MIFLHLCQYSYICVNTEYILYILYFCLIVIHILLSQSIVPHDKSYVFLSLDRNKRHHNRGKYMMRRQHDEGTAWWENEIIRKIYNEETIWLED